MRGPALALLATAAVAAPPPAGGEGRERVLDAAREVLGQAGLCSLVTLDEAGAPQVRTMDPFPPEAGFRW